MTQKNNRHAVRKVLPLCISAIGMTVASAGVLAQSEGPSEEVLRLIRPDSEVSVGVIGVSQNNFKFGDYNGLQKKGTHLDADIRVNKRGEGNANYLDITGSNLGLDSRNFQIRGGEQGNFGLSLEYDEIHKLWSDSYQTPYLNPGSDRVTLPAGWVSNCATSAAPGVVVGCGVATTSASTGLMPNLPGSMRSFNIETQRKSIALGGSKILPSDWDVSVDFKHETKQGSRLIGAVIGNSGGNPRAAVLPEPVDYVTRQFNAIARYTTDTLQFQAAYTGSLFDNKKTSLVFQNAYSNGAGTWGIAAVGFPLGFGQIGLPPDNQAHQLSASLGYQLSKATRLAGSFSYNRMTQNEAFLPYTINTGLTSPIALPRGSLEGKVNATHLDLKLTSKLNKDLNLLALYRYDDRANKTPQSLFNYIGGDSANQVAAGANSDRLRYNLPGSSTKQQIEIEADYRLAAHTKLKFGWGYDWVKKTFEAINSESEHTLKGEVHQHFSDSASGGLSYAWSDRKTSNYDATVPFMAAFTPAFINAAGNSPALGLNWDNNPEQKRFFMAPRTRDKLRAFVNLTPAENVDLHLGVDYKNDNFSKSTYGLQDAKGWGVNADANVKLSDALTAQVFTSWNRYTSLERSNTYGCAANGTAAGGGSLKLAVAHPNCDWSATLADHNVTAGVGVRYQPGSKYELGADYIYATSIGKTDMWAGPIAGTITAMPENSTNLKRLDLFARYELQKNVSLNVKYIYERYESKDWALEGVVSNTLANVIGTNQVAPNYSAHALGVMVNYRFD